MHALVFELNVFLSPFFINEMTKKLPLNNNPSNDVIAVMSVLPKNQNCILYLDRGAGGENSKARREGFVARARLVTLAVATVC